MKKLILMFLIACFALLAQEVPVLATQSPVAAIASPPAEAQFILAAGVGFNHYATPQCVGELSFSTHIATGTYSITTLKMTSAASSIATGGSRRIYSNGPITIATVAQAGVASGGGAVSGTISGGGVLAVDISKFAKIDGAFAYGGVQVVESPVAGGVQPAFSFGVGWRSK